MSAVNINDYLTLPRPTTVWIWSGIIPSSGSTLVFGDPKVGKSKLILSLCEAIADPEIDEYLGLPINTHGNVLYVQLDTPRSLWVSGYISAIHSEKARQSIYMLDREMPEVPKLFDIRIPECRDWLRREVDMVSPIMTVIDTVRRMHKGKENDSDVMEHVVDCFYQACFPSARLLVSHKKKQQQGDVGDGSARGSSALTGAVDGLVNMRKDRLLIEARSDVAEEIPIVQQVDGTFKLNTRDREVEDFVKGLSSSLGNRQKDDLIAEQFGVTSRTARTWRLNMVR